MGDRAHGGKDEKESNVKPGMEDKDESERDGDIADSLDQ